MKNKLLYGDPVRVLHTYVLHFCMTIIYILHWYVCDELWWSRWTAFVPGQENSSASPVDPGWVSPDDFFELRTVLLFLFQETDLLLLKARRCEKALCHLKAFLQTRESLLETEMALMIFKDRKWESTLKGNKWTFIYIAYILYIYINIIRFSVFLWFSSGVYKAAVQTAVSAWSSIQRWTYYRFITSINVGSMCVQIRQAYKSFCSFDLKGQHWAMIYIWIKSFRKANSIWLKGQCVQVNIHMQLPCWGLSANALWVIADP